MNKSEIESSGGDACSRVESCREAMTASLGDGMAILDEDFRILCLNPAFLNLVKRSQAGPGDAVLELFPESCRGELSRVLSSALSGRPGLAELDLGCGADEPWRAFVTVSPLARQQGRPVSLAMLLVDVSTLADQREVKQKEILKALSESESTSRALLDATLDSAFLFDSDGIIHAANEHGARKMGGVGTTEMIGRSMADFIAPELFENRMRHIRKVFDSGEAMRFEDSRDGLILDNNLLPVFDESGRVHRVAVFSRDITARRAIEEQLRRRAFQQGVVAELGLAALGSSNLDELMEKTCRLAARVFDSELSEVMILTPDQDHLLMTTAVGWPSGMAGSTVQDLEMTQAGLALATNAPVVVDNLAEDRRLRNSQLLLGQGVVSGVSVVIHGVDHPYGVLGVHSIRQRHYTDDEVNTLQAVANVLSASVARMQSQRQLGSLSERHAAILGSVALGIFGVDSKGLITFANPAVERLTGFHWEELLGANAHWILHHTRVDGSVYPEEECPLTLTLADGKPRRIEEEVYWRKDGTSFPVDYSCAPLFEKGLPEGAVVVFEDITQRKRAQERLKRLAFFDELTGLPNRAQLKLRLEAVLERDGAAPRFALLFLDLDDFKVVNDGLGHTLGDRFLKAVSDRLREAIGSEGMLVRLGGDEFALLLENIDGPEVALDAAERIHANLATPERLEGYEIFVSASIGAVVDDGHHEEVDDVLRDADTAMFKAKSQGKGGLAVFDRAMLDAVRSRLMLENDLRRALDRDEFFLVYQPIVDLATRAPAGFEALLRWQHPERGLISPLDFIPVAEASGLILPIGEWVLASACTQLAEWRRTLPDIDALSMSVNLSGRQFMQQDLTGRIDRILRESNLPPGAVKLEITESVIMENAGQAVETLEEMKQMGLLLMIDDFGTGYSSLAYLRRFPVDALKLDRAFVRNLDTDRDNFQIAKAVVQLAHSLELDVVAEGIEKESELTELSKLGCRFGQGYYFARPLSAGAAQAYLLDRKS